MPSLSHSQLELIKEADLSIHLSPEFIAQIATQADPKQLTDEQLLEFCKSAMRCTLRISNACQIPFLHSELNPNWKL